MIEAYPKSLVPFAPFVPNSRLTTYRVANVFNCFSDLPAGFPEAFLYLTARIIYPALGFEIFIVDSSADSLFGLAFGLIPFSFKFVSIR